MKGKIIIIIIIVAYKQTPLAESKTVSLAMKKYALLMFPKTTCKVIDGQGSQQCQKHLVQGKHRTKLIGIILGPSSWIWMEGIDPRLVFPDSPVPAFLKILKFYPCLSPHLWDHRSMRKDDSI